ncbi:MAG: alpha/beta hydrolase [Myxococcota bacterium]
MMLYSETRGDGRDAVLLLHGFLGSGRNLASLARRWTERAPHLRLYLLDLPGHGRSDPLPPGADLGTLARSVLDTARALAIPQPWRIVGHSLGGRVALRALRDAPGTIDRIALLDISPAPLPPRSTRLDRVLEQVLAAPERATTRAAMAAFFLAAGIPAPLVDWLLLNLTTGDDGAVHWRIDREALGAFHARASAEDLWSALDAKNCRLRCIRGGRSPFVSDADATRLAGLGCDVVTIAGADHFLHVEQQVAVLEALSAREFWQPVASTSLDRA